MKKARKRWELSKTIKSRKRKKPKRLATEW